MSPSPFAAEPGPERAGSDVVGQSPLSQDRAAAVLRWLVPLRFLSALGQMLAIELGRAWLALPLPYERLWIVPIVVVATNFALVALQRGARDLALRLVVPVLVFDAALFTLLLAWSGGPDSPFSALYVIQIVLATMTGHRRATWVVAVACAAFYALVFPNAGPAFFWHAPIAAGSSIGLHALGMWVAVLVVAVVITFFMTRIIETLGEREREMRSLGEIAARNARLASLTTLAAGAAHELGSPLGTIAVIARELERTGAAPHPDLEGLAEDAKLLRAEVERCRGILDRMRARAAHELRESETPIVAAEVETTLFEGLDADERERVRIEVAASPVTPLGARLDFVEIVGPILRNALDASAPGRSVEVGIRIVDDRLQAIVKDHGDGMDAATLEHAGEPFFTTRPPGRGTGLGLFVVNLHLERLGGSLRFESAKGIGTIARVEWPLARPLAGRSASSRTAPRNARAGGDDDEVA